MTWITVATLMAGCGGGDGVTGGRSNGGGASTANGGSGASDPPAEGTGGSGELGNVPERVRDYIRSDTFTRLVVEVDFVPGFEPRPEVARQMETGLGAILDKPGGVEVVIDGPLDSRGSDHEWTFDELDQLATETFDLAVSDDVVKMHALFIDGRDADPDRNLLGLAWSNQHMVLWKMTLENQCSGVLGLTGFCPAAERTIWTHEAGHVLGLVNNGLPMATEHEDPEHEHHDADPACVMYWAYDGESALDALQQRFVGGSDEALGFCESSLADVAAVRSAE